jgi:tetratricopeptide (TPR) repeat protein
MAGHGHDNCPHCEHQLEGLEAVCPACQGDLFGVPSKIVQVKEKVSEIVQKVQSEVRDAISVEGDLVGSVQRATHKIGDHVVPVFSTVKQVGTDAVEKVRDKIGGDASQQANQQDFDEEEEDLESLITQGELLVSEGREHQAMKIFNRVIASDPSNAMAWFNRGVIHEMSGQVDEAAKAFKVCLDMQEDHGPAAANLAVLLDRTGSSAEAAIFAHRALKSFPSHPDLARISNQGPAAESTTIETQVVSSATPEPITAPAVQPEPSPQVIEQPASPPEIDLDAIVEDAANLIKQNQPEKGLELLRDLLHNEASQHPRAWRVAAASMARLSLIDNAIEAFTYALDLDNTDAASWYNLGALHRRNDHEETAVTCFDAALGLRPDYTKASAALAEIHTANGSLTLAIESWRALLSHEPDNKGGPTFAGILIAIAEGEGEVLEMAIEIPTTIPEGPELATEALKYIPDNGSSENVQLRARAMTLSGSYPEAVKAWRSLIETDRDNPDLWTGMRKTFIAAGDQATAEKCRAKIASLTGENVEAVGASEPAETSVPEPVQEPEPIQEPEPQLETSTEPEEVVSDDPWSDDPWGDMDSQTDSSDSTDSDDDAEKQTSEDVVAAEEILDTTPEPEPIIQTEASPEVDLAKAALDVASNTPEPAILGSGKIDSSSISNQDVQWYNKGLTLLTDEKYKEALACFDRALPTFVNDDEMVVRILNARGNAFYYLKKFSDCIDAYHEAMRVNPAGVTGATLYNMGTAYAEVERYADAIKCFEQGMSEKRESPLVGDHAKMAKEQIRRCKLLLREQDKKMKRLSRMKN